MRVTVCSLVLGVVLNPCATGVLAQETAESGNSVELLQRPPAQGEAVLWYLGKDGFAVRTANHFLVFDPPDTGMENSFALPESADSLSSGMVNPETVKDLNVVVFTSAMGDEHYRTGIWPWARYIDNITYVFGWDPVINQDNHEYVYLKPGDERRIGDLAVSAIQATTSGAAFLVSVDGLSLLHGGDHVMAEPAQEELFVRGIDYLASLDRPVDILFIDFQVGPGLRPPSIAKGIQYADSKLDPAAIFPMGAIDATVPRYLRSPEPATYEHLIDDLIAETPAGELRSKFVRTVRPGHAFLYRGGEVTSLEAN